MTTSTKTRARSTNLDLDLDGKSVFATPTGLKLGSRGSVAADGAFLGVLPRGTARKVRKAMRRAGLAARAGAPRGK